MAASYLVSTVAGCLQPGFTDGRGVNTKFNCPRGLAFSRSGGIIVADKGNHCIRRVTITGRSPAHVETFAGCHGQAGYQDGDEANALFNSPRSVSVSDSGTVYVADTGNYRLRTIDNSKVVKTLAGSGRRNVADGIGEDASFMHLFDVTWVRGEGLFVCGSSCTMRHVAESGMVSSVAGKPGKSDHVNGGLAQAKFSDVVVQIACYGQGQKLLADEGNHAIRIVHTERHGGVRVKTVAGGHQGFQNGPVDTSKFHSPRGVAVDNNGLIYVADYANHRIRMIALGPDEVPVVSTIAGCGEKGLRDGPGAVAKLQNPSFLLMDHSSNTLYFTQDHCIRKITLPDKRSPNLEYFSSMLHDLKSLTVSKSNVADVMFIVEGKPVYSYKALLSVRSQYFRGMFSSGVQESNSTAKIAEIPIEDVNYESFKALIVYLTTDQLTLDPNNYVQLCRLLSVCSKFNEDKLKRHCENMLILLMKSDNVKELIQMAEKFQASYLRDAALRFTSLSYPGNL